MAEQWPTAFGRYLRSLRESRGLSLAEASRLSRSSIEPFDKGTLSRFEHGQQRIPAAKLVPLSRIYCVPAGALIERLELDMELDRVGWGVLDASDPSELKRIGTRAVSHHHSKWVAYGAFREALFRRSEHSEPFIDESEEAIAWTNYALSVRALGKNRLALHEFERIERSGRLPERRHAILLDRMSNCYRCLGDFTRAVEYAGEAIREATEFGEKRILAFAHTSNATAALDQGDQVGGIVELQTALQANMQAKGIDCLLSPNPSFEVGNLLKLAEASHRMGFLEKARKTAAAAKRLSLGAVIPGGLGYSELILGDLDDTAGDFAQARRRWKHAYEIAESIHDKRLSFAAEFYIFRSTLRRGEMALSRASSKRLERLAPWVPEHYPLLAEYRDLNRTDPRSANRRPSGSTKPQRGR